VSDRLDLVVVGGGLAGLAAANRAAEQDLRVVVLEKGAEELYPCNSRYAMGFLNCAFQDIRGEPAVLRRAIDRLTAGFADASLATVFSESAGDAVRWLAAQGVRIIKGGWEPGQRALLAPPPLMRPGLNWRGRGADSMVRRLIAMLEQRGGRLMRDTRVDSLVMSQGRCVGVQAMQRGAAVQFDAATVLIADGGFQANEELLRRYITPQPDRVLQRNARSGNGDGLRMAIVAGAAIRGMERFYGHLQSRDALANPLLWPYPTADAPAVSGITVNAHGMRFADEGLGGVYLANEVAKLADPLSAVAICDDAAWRGPCRQVTRPPNPLIARVGGTVHSAYSLEALAELAGLPAAELVATVKGYNRAIDHGATEALAPPRTTAVHKAMPVRTPPYYAVPLCAGITYTMGGIFIDGRCRVLREDGSTIDGLYAAGSCTGGHEGGPVAGYTGGLGKAMTFGWHAGNCIAGMLDRTAPQTQRAA
jgi:fumarate reductase flavoprotein subunit